MKKPWFKNTKNGLAWYPVAWQGWLVVALFFIVVIPTVAYIVRTAPDTSDGMFSRIVTHPAIVGSLVGLLIVRNERGSA